MPVGSMSDLSTCISSISVILTLGQPASETTSLLLDYMSFPAHTGGISLGILLIMSLSLSFTRSTHSTQLSYLDKKLNIRVFVLNNFSRHDTCSYCSFSLFPSQNKKARRLCLSSEIYILQKQVKTGSLLWMVLSGDP